MTRERESGRPRQDLLDAVREALAAGADPDRAAQQQAYMKSALPYRGLSNADMRRAVLPILRDPAHRMEDRATWEATVLALYDEATHREERSAAIELTGIRPYRHWQDPGALDLYAEMVRTGQWWDLVDVIAADRIGPILKAFREESTDTIRDWSTDPDDLWLRRTAIICQLKHGADTDLALLSDAIEDNLEGTAFGSTFWIRKAIGWALRQHARTDPDWVRGFVATHEGPLSGLSRREALKHLS